jgi:hypothetical protein
LEFGDRPSELAALLRVAERDVVSSLREAYRERGDGDAPAVQDFEAVDKTLALLAE